MPNENEFNYVLNDPDGDLERSLAADPTVFGFDVRQGYLSDDLRLRSFRNLRTQETSFVLSFKRRVGGDQIELETFVPKADFDRLMPGCKTRLHKRRYVIQEEGIHWDVDFLKSRRDGSTYFVKAEAEVDDTVDEPPLPCATIEDHVVHVPGKAKGFSSRKLADEDYARALGARIVRLYEKGEIEVERRIDRAMGM